MNLLVDDAARFLDAEAHAAFILDVKRVRSGEEERSTVLSRWRPQVSAQRTAWEDVPLEVGLLVELHSLSHAELNGRIGFCDCWESERARFGIALLQGEPGSRAKLAVRPSNLRRAPPATHNNRSRATELARAANAKLSAARNGQELGPFQASEVGRGVRADARRLFDEAHALVEEAAALESACLAVHLARCDRAISLADRAGQVLHARRGIANGTRAADRKQRLQLRLALSSALGETCDFEGAIAQSRAVLSAEPEPLLRLHARLNLGMALSLGLNPRGDDEEACVQLMMALQLPADGSAALPESLLPESLLPENLLPENLLPESHREMALGSLLHAIARRRRCCLTQGGDGAHVASLDATLHSLMQKYPEAVQRWAARSQMRAAGMDDSR